MADKEVRYEDVSQIRSRISWGAIIGGMVIAFGAYMILTLLFAGIGVSLNRDTIRSDGFGIAAIVAAVCTMIIAMFLGGWVTTQLTAGETRREAVIHGILCWGAVTGAALCMAMSTAKSTGYFALLGGSMVAQATPANQNWEAVARAQNVPQERIDQWKRDLNATNAQAALTNPQTQEDAKQIAMAAIWGTLIGTLLSMGAAVGGALVGAGPNFRLLPVAAGARHQEIIIARS
jgi:hypothetical protein